MRKILLWWDSARSSLFASIILFIAVTMVLFTFSDACAAYRYKAIAHERFTSVFDGQGVFFADAAIGDFRFDYTVENSEQRLDFINTLRKNPSVSDVYSAAQFNIEMQNGNEGLVNCYSDAMLDLIPELSRGEWFDSPVNADGSINTIICGTEYWDIPLGTKITAKTSSGEEIVFNTCGFLYVPALLPSFNSFSSKMSFSTLYHTSNCFVIEECDETVDLLLDSGSSFGMEYMTYFVEFEEDATNEDVDAVLNQLTMQGGYQEISDICVTLKNETRTSFLTYMMTPLFLLCIAFIAYFSISILSVQKRLYSYSVYYLLGYSKSRMVLSSVCHVGLILIPSVILNVWYTLSYRTWVMNGIIEPGRTDAELYFDSLSPWFVIGAAVFLFVITLAACLALLHKKSPADVWRRSKE